MGNQRFLVVLAVALVVAVGAGYGVYRLLQQTRAQSEIPMQEVVVAAADLLEGQRIALEQLAVAKLPVAAIPAGAFVSIDSVVGRITRIAVFTGEVLVPGRLAPEGATAGLEVRITPGKRAMAVRIDDVAGLSGLIQPNSRVDVLVTIKEASGDAEQQSKLIMSNMRVLSIGSQVERGPDGRAINATTAALEVTPVEAEELAIAANQGRIQLVLRGYGDPDTVQTRGATVSDVLREGRSATSGRVLDSRPSPPNPRPRTTSRAPTRREAPATSPPPSAPPVAQPTPPRRPDSSVVQVYRRDQLSQQKVGRTDTIPPR